MATQPYISSMRASLLIAAAIFVHMPAWAQDPAKDRKAEAQAAVAAAQKAQVLGPADIKLADQAVLKLPQGYTYIPAAEGSRLMTVMGNRVGDGMLGLVFPDSDRKWFVVMHFAKSGYIKDDDAKDWKADELLKGLKEGTEEANKDRRERGIREIEVLGWVEPPTYDAATHRLIWSLSSKQKGDAEGAERGINYNTYALGRDIVTPFQVDTYRSARDAGMLPLLWFALVIAAPVAEEIMFRGFLFRGWITSERWAIPGILIISALFAAIHIQYDWFGILQVFFIGLLFGLVRWRSGSTTLTILMHVFANFWATVETMIKVEWLS